MTWQSQCSKKEKVKPRGETTAYLEVCYAPRRTGIFKQMSDILALNFTCMLTRLGCVRVHCSLQLVKPEVHHSTLVCSKQIHLLYKISYFVIICSKTKSDVIS